MYSLTGVNSGIKFFAKPRLMTFETVLGGQVQKLGSKIKNGYFVETKSYRNHRHKTSVITISRRVNGVFFYK
jgi:hypothetical protein